MLPEFTMGGQAESGRTVVQYRTRPPGNTGKLGDPATWNLQVTGFIEAAQLQIPPAAPATRRVLLELLLQSLVSRSGSVLESAERSLNLDP